MALSDYERALLRLKAWKACQGWGENVANEDATALEKLAAYKTWNWPTRLSKAAELYEWMIEQTFAPGWRHKKRGTEYIQVGIADLQSSGSIKEGDRLVIYRERDGTLWARPFFEFHDGRFERIKD